MPLAWQPFDSCVSLMHGFRLRGGGANSPAFSIGIDERPKPGPVRGPDVEADGRVGSSYLHGLIRPAENKSFIYSRKPPARIDNRPPSSMVERIPA